MATEHNVIYLIEYLRGKMVRLAGSKGDLGNHEVIQVSQQLDLYLLQMQLRVSEPGNRLNESIGFSFDALYLDTFPTKNRGVLPSNTAVQA